MDISYLHNYLTHTYAEVLKVMNLTVNSGSNLCFRKFQIFDSQNNKHKVATVKKKWLKRYKHS